MTYCSHVTRQQPCRSNTGVRTLFAAITMLATLSQATAQGSRTNDAYRPPAEQPYETNAPQPAYGAPVQPYGAPNAYGQNGAGPNTYRQTPTYTPPAAYRNQGGPYGNAPPQQPAYGGEQPYGGERPYANQPANPPYDTNQGYGGGERTTDAYQPPRQDGYGQPYSPPPSYPSPSDQGPGPREPYRAQQGSPTRGYYTEGEITEKGRGFFGSITQGLASAIEYTYQTAGRPNGYLLGEDGGGAFFAGLRYGEGMLFTKDAGDHKVFWQGPSLGYDVGGEGSKVMVLVYNMSEPGDIYRRFGGVEGSAYLVGGVSVQFQKSDNVTLAVIRSGVGLRLGANVGYLKYTRSPTWNPF
jgi:hypothetical protein